MFDKVSNGPITGVAAGAATVASGVDATNQNLYLAGPAGWVPAAPSTLARVGLTGQTANVSNVLTFAAPLAGLYQVSIFEESANAPTGATLPAVTATYTDKDTGTSITDTLASKSSVSAANVLNNGTLLVRPNPGSNLVIATTSYAAGSGTALSYNLHVRVTYLG